jgi:hypothetical protein
MVRNFPNIAQLLQFHTDLAPEIKRALYTFAAVFFCFFKA